MKIHEILQRPINDESSSQNQLFDLDDEWRKHWWGMPSFDMKDSTPRYSITINFLTKEHLEDFRKLTSMNIGIKTDSAWYPEQPNITPGRFRYTGPNMGIRYPVCIPSKGRHDCQTTGRLLDNMGVPYLFFVEEHERDLYVERLGDHRVVSLPFSNLGQGSIPARNFIWEWAKDRGHKKHWILDDNITEFCRCTLNRRLNVYGGGFFRCIEDFADRYTNVAMAGPNGKGFVMDRNSNVKPFTLNTRVYSCTLIDTGLSERWRGKYNEDTDICLRLLKAGYCTVLFNALLMQKHVTSGAVGTAMKGGNTDNVYNTDDRRLKFAESLRDQHPDVVKVTWKFNRWHHEVNYKPFKKNRLKLVENITPVAENNEYGMELTDTKAIDQ